MPSCSHSPELRHLHNLFGLYVSLYKMEFDRLICVRLIRNAYFQPDHVLRECRHIDGQFGTFCIFLILASVSIRESLEQEFGMV